MNIQIISTPKTLNAILESWFIQNILLGGYPWTTKLDGDYQANIVIYVELYEIDAKLIQNLKAMGKKVVLMHMGDERADKDIYSYPLCDLIIRNYYFSEITPFLPSGVKTLWIPNGFRTGVGPRNVKLLQKALEREHLTCFLGWLNNTASFGDERAIFSRLVNYTLKKKLRSIPRALRWISNRLAIANNSLRMGGTHAIKREDIHLLGSEGFSDGYNVGLYASVMESSIFAPCPAGNSPETIRLYDALECGCIPIYLSHAFLTSPNALAAIGPIPFPLLSSWDDLPKFLEQMKLTLKTQPEEIIILQRNCIDWWSNYKQYIARSIHDHIKFLHS